MSFTPPTLYASQANTGAQSQFQIGSPLAAVSEVKTFSLDPISMNQIEVTHLLSPGNTSEYIPGLIKQGTLSFSGNYLGDASQLAITTHANARDIFAFSITAPVQRLAKTLTITGTGFFSSFKLGPFENEKPIEFSADIQLASAATYAVA